MIGKGAQVAVDRGDLAGSRAPLRRIGLAVIAGGLLLGATSAPTRPASPATFPSPGEVDAMLDQAQRELADVGMRAMRARWVNSTYITADTDAIAQEANAEEMATRLRWAKAAARYRNVPGLTADAQRKVDLLRRDIILPPPDRPDGARELSALLSRQKSAYALGKGRLDRRPISGSDIDAAMAANRDPARLEEMWASWHDAVGRPMKPDYVRLVGVANEGARELGFADMGELWRSAYDIPPQDVPPLLDRMWHEIDPLYTQLHCYVRRRLSERYGDGVQPDKGPIRADLLGNMWGQEWGNVYDIVAPKGTGDIGYSVADLLKRQDYDAPKMVHAGERFYTSMGFPSLPPSFWTRSMLVRPRDRDASCQAQAWDMDDKSDVRLKTCLRVSDDDFATVHHELGHLYYYMAYAEQAKLYREGANAGFHEAVGDAIQLAITPDYLVDIGLLDRAHVPSPDKDIGLLLRQALDKIALMPFALTVDRWRWGVFDGSIKPDMYQRDWDRLRLDYQGLRPPVARPDDAFDPGAKYHIAAVSPYTGYFVARILQFQFYKAACDMSGWKGPLHRCTFYGNREVGRRINAMLAMGRSRPWPEALKTFTGSNRLTSAAMLEYFAPLDAWLRRQNKGHSCGW